MSLSRYLYMYITYIYIYINFVCQVLMSKYIYKKLRKKAIYIYIYIYYKNDCTIVSFNIETLKSCADWPL